MKTLRLACRKSKLSITQTGLVAAALQQQMPDAQIELVYVDTAGDIDQRFPLYQMQGRDFFSKEIDTALLSGKADIAVHSMKDLSGERITDPRFYGAVVERQPANDVLLISANGKQKVHNGEPLRIGTSSLRRQELLPRVLPKILPYGDKPFPQPQFLPIRGNIDSRVEKLVHGEFDAIVLAAAGLIRLSASHENGAGLRLLLEQVSALWLPLMECPPAPAQGALRAECLTENAAVKKILESINQPTETQLLQTEREAVNGMGGGCHQRYGSVAINHKNNVLVNVVGVNENGQNIDKIHFSPTFDWQGKMLVSSTDFMAEFFKREYTKHIPALEADTVFVSHHKSVTDELLPLLKTKRIFAAGMRTWQELAKKGLWLEGCADGFGFDFAQPMIAGITKKYAPHDIVILTNAQSAEEWQNDGYNAQFTYSMVPSVSKALATALAQADMIFWTSYQQYEAAKSFINPNVMHLCPAGRTADRFQKQGITPHTFPNIQTFLAWKNHHIR